MAEELHFLILQGKEFFVNLSLDLNKTKTKTKKDKMKLINEFEQQNLDPKKI